LLISKSWVTTAIAGVVTVELHLLDVLLEKHGSSTFEEDIERISFISFVEYDPAFGEKL